ncbi:MAG TPA: NADH-quinone oxidoreductase subunit M [candidate division Zixibacteria bacterium]|nr:NADH-quinone oxidoreductase subunit M [candidate division Zixibacteria bacterium]
MQGTLLLTLLLPTLSVPFVYFTGKKSAKVAAVLIALIALADIVLLSTTVPTVFGSAEHRYVESYYWIPVLNASFTLFVDGVSLSLAIVTSVLVLAAALFSVGYMREKKGLAEYYGLLSLLSIGLLGVFITSNLILFYFCWELVLIPAYFIIGGWGYREPYRAAFKFFVFTHAGAAFVLLGIGGIYITTGSLDMFQARNALMSIQPDIVKWILLSLTAGFAVKMAIVPVHMWLPDAHSEAPAPMSALLSGVIIGAGAYAIFRVSLGTVFPAVMATDFGAVFMHGLAVFGVLSAFFGSFIALVENDIKRVIAYSSISHMGYVLFGLSMIFSGKPMQLVQVVMAGTALHIINHAVSKGLFFLSSGGIMKQLEIRDIREMGGLAGQMPITATSSTIAALSIAGVPPFACFISEFLIFVGAFKAISIDGFYLLPTAFMIVATVLSLAYALRYVSHVFLGPTKREDVKESPLSMRIAMLILGAFVIVLGVWPTFFLDLINTLKFV